MTVSNDGDPISDANREKIFDAFFTTRRDTGGTGMGLAIVQAGYDQPRRIDPATAVRSRRCV
jgi:signal transduction histidine kinase